MDGCKIKNNKEKNKGKQVSKPSENDCIQFFQEKKFEAIEGSRFYHYWESMDWTNPFNNPTEGFEFIQYYPRFHA